VIGAKEPNITLLALALGHIIAPLPWNAARALWKYWKIYSSPTIEWQFE